MTSNGALFFLRSDGSVMQEAGLEIEMVDVVERKYTGSWFCMQDTGLPSDQTSVVETQCGGRQGCIFGGIIFYQNVIDDQGVMQRRGPSCKSSTGLVLEVVCD